MESPCLERRHAGERVAEDDRDALGRVLGAQPGAGRARAQRHARAGVQPLPVQQAAARRAVQLQVPARGADQQAAVVAPRAAHAMREAEVGPRCQVGPHSQGTCWLTLCRRSRLKVPTCRYFLVPPRAEHALTCMT